MDTTSNNSQLPQQESETVISRGEFIRSMGMSSAALMAFYCMGTLSSCKSSTSDPAPVVITPGGTTPGGSSNGVTGTATGSAINFTIDLTNANFTTLKTTGSFVNVGDVIVFNSGGSYKALGRKCTHQGGNLVYSPPGDELICDLHSSHYSSDGTVKSQPIGGGVATSVKAYSTALSGNSLTVKA